MTLEEAITTFGYPVVFIGTLMEGETVLVLAGYVAHRGYLSLEGVLATAFVGSFLGDQLCFWFGKRHGRAWLEKRPRWRERAHRLKNAMGRAEPAVLLGFRFVIGTRMATPVVLGATGFPAWRFAWWNMLGAAVWSVGIGLAGFFFGRAVEAVLDEAKRYELMVIVGIALVGCVAGAAWLLLAKRRSATAKRAALSAEPAAP